jgi:hypothetical protein
MLARISSAFLGPAEGFWIGIGGLDLIVDRLPEFADRTEHATLDGAIGEERKAALDLIEP